MPAFVDTIVLGGGAVGSAAAWQLASRGTEVTLLERLGPLPDGGGPIDRSRPFELACSDPVQLRMLADSARLWRELEAETGQVLLTETGAVSHGHHPAFDDLARMLPNVGFDAELVPAAEAESRWPGIRFDDRVLVTPQAGRIDAVAAVTALQRAAAERGALVRHRSRVTRIRVLGDDRAAVELTPTDAAGEPVGDREVLECRRLVVTLGAWTSKLLGSVLVLPRLTVTREEPVHLAPLDASGDWPGFTHFPSPGAGGYPHPLPVRGLLTPSRGVTVSGLAAAPVIDPEARITGADRRRVELLQRYAREWLPGVDAAVAAQPGSPFLSTSTRDSSFVIDRMGPVTVGGGFSGHGFAVVPVVGRMLADLVDGIRAPAVFSLRADRRREAPRAASADPRTPDRRGLSMGRAITGNRP